MTDEQETTPKPFDVIDGENNEAILEGTLQVPLLIGEEEINALAEAFAIGRKGKAYSESEFEAIVFWASDAVFRHKMFRAVVEGVVNIDITENGELFFDLNRSPEEAKEDTDG